MLRNEIESIISRLTTFGKLNAILHFNSEKVNCEIIYKDVISLFNPDEIKCSLFDLDKKDVKFIESFPSKVSNENIIIRVQFIKEGEQVFFECYKNCFIVEHLLAVDNISDAEGNFILNKYYREQNNSILVLGFELSVNIDSFESSLLANVSDESLLPILVVRNKNRRYLVEEFVQETNRVTERRVGVLRDYLRLLQLS